MFTRAITQTAVAKDQEQHGLVWIIVQYNITSVIVNHDIDILYAVQQRING